MSTGTLTAADRPALLVRSLADPVGYARHILGLDPYDRQEEIIQLLAKPNLRRLSIVGANKVGKDWAIASVVIPWWHTVHQDAMTVVLAPTHRQIHDIIWRMLKLALAGSLVPLGGVISETDRWQITDTSLAVGLATDEPLTLQGYHSPHLLVVCSEAHYLSDEHLDAAARLGPDLLIMSGNPLSVAGRFYDSHHTRRDQWETVSIPGASSPNIRAGAIVVPGLLTPQDIADRRAEWGEDNPLYIASVLGEWPTSLVGGLIPLSQVAAATQRSLRAGTPDVVACDPAASETGDKTVVWHRRGPVAEMVFRSQGQATMATAGWLKAYMRGHPNVDTLVVDQVGIGWGLTERLQEQGIPVVPFNGGAKPQGTDEQEKYADRNTEAWCTMAEAFRAGEIQIPPDQALMSQLVSRRVNYRSDGKTRVESKEALRPRDGLARASWRSPDEADALAMTFAGAVPLERHNKQAFMPKLC